MENQSHPPAKSRIGFHYFPDTLHYRESDLAIWLPELRSLGASWLTLVANTDAAIPEPFLRGLMDAGIEPILHFPLSLDTIQNTADFRLLFSTYARWGIKYVALFDCPNAKRSWGTAGWAQSNLVERFLDIYLPLAETALHAGLSPVFPPLQPGGDYWDTAFLRAALQSMQRRGHSRLVDELLLGAYAWYGDQPLNWGAGGPERWPSSRPYDTPAGTEDQRGFRIFDWYQAIYQAVTGKPARILLLKTGFAPTGGQTGEKAFDPQRHAQYSLLIARQLRSAASADPFAAASGSAADALEPIPDTVLAANFWLLSSVENHPASPTAWISHTGSRLPAAEGLQRYVAEHPTSPAQPAQPAMSEATGRLKRIGLPAAYSHRPFLDPAGCTGGGDRRIAHYLLLPAFDWGIADWHLDVIRPFVKKYRPTVGFSPNEAVLADQVTVVGEEVSFPPNLIKDLRAAGCKITQVHGDGTSIASQLASI